MAQELTDFTIKLQNIKSLAPKMNQGLVIIFVIDGELTVETNDRYYQLTEKDLLVINRNQVYQTIGKQENHVFMLHISDRFMLQHYEPYPYSHFECFSGEVDMEKDDAIKRIRKLLAELIIAYFRKRDSYRIEVQSYISDILLILIRRFRQQGRIKERVDTSDERLKEIIDYIEMNYDQKISLDEVADKFYLSSSYLSRYFKNKVGIGFNRYLMNIRLEHAVKELLYTTESISNIAMNHGFPNVKSFVRYFKEAYNETPKAYRDANQKLGIDTVRTYDQEDAVQYIQTSAILGELALLLTDSDTAYSSIETESVELALDIHEMSPTPIHRPQHHLAIGELREILKDGVRQQILMAKQEIQIDQIMVRKLIGGSTFMPPVETDEIIASTSPYYHADFALNFLRKHDLPLFVRIDYQEISEDEANYFEQLRHFINHCLNVHGRSYLEQWQFMFYEPLTIVNTNELERVYLQLYETLKALLPGVRVGAFLPFSFHEGEVANSHSWLVDKDVPVDFFGYEANQNKVINFEELGDDRFALAEDFILKKTIKLKAYLRERGKNQPLNLVSWNTLTGNTRHTNGTFFRGALVLKNAFDLADEVASLGFWINTEQHEKLGTDRKIRLGGLELFHFFNGKRPAYFAMQFLQKLTGKIIAQGREYIMTENERGYQLILMNVNSVNPYLTIQETFLKKLNKEIRVTIAGLEPGNYQIRKRVFDKDHGALYTKWWELNSKYGMDEEVIDYITATSQPSLEIFDTKIDSELTIFAYMSLNAIHFFEIRRAYDG